MKRASSNTQPCTCHAFGPQRPALVAAPVGNGAELQVRPAARGSWLVVSIQRWHTRQGRRHVARSSASGVPAVTGRIVIRSDELADLVRELTGALAHQTHLTQLHRPQNERKQPMALPTKKTEPNITPERVRMLIYGPPKIGKTTFAADAPDVVFAAAEAGHDALSVFKVDIKTWDDLLEAGRELAAGKHQFKTIALDTIDNLWRLCTENVLGKLKIEHESDAGFGKAYGMIQAEFHRVLTRFSLLPYGLILISHSQEKTFETRTGEITRVVPTLPEKARKIVLGLVDVIVFVDLEVTKEGGKVVSSKRVLRTKPSQHYEAGDRSGRLPDTIDLSWNAFATAYTAPKPSGKPAAQASATPATNKSTAAASTPKTPPSQPKVSTTVTPPAQQGRQQQPTSPSK